jgi:hypothetical protein
MKPRLTSSKKWTPLPKDFLTQIEQVFSDAFAAQLVTGKLIVEGCIFPAEIVLRVGFLEKGRLKQDNFEISVDYSKEKQDAVDRIHNCIDAAASMMNEFFESAGDVDFPLHWKNFDFNGNIVWAQYTTENTTLEEEANALLGVEKNLVYEEVSEDALAHSEKIPGEDEREDEGEEDLDHDEDLEDEEESEDNEESPASKPDLSKPSIFSSKKSNRKSKLH